MNAIPSTAPQGPHAGPGWHKPGAALARFEAPAGSLVASAASSPSSSLRREFARYGFRVGGLGLLIAEGTDAELVEGAGIAPIPHAPAALLGMMNRRGHPIPVFDLRVALELPEPKEPSATTLVLILGKGDDALALRADTRPQPLRGLAATAPSTVLPPRLAPYCSAAWLADGELWVEFDHRGFFTASSVQEH